MSETNCYTKKPSIFRRLKWFCQSIKRRFEPSSMERWAQKELDLILAQCDDKDGLEMQRRINRHLMLMVKQFTREGHSGTSANYAINMLRRLLSWKPITPLTGEESEWGDIIGSTDNCQQNKRCSAVFRKNYDNSTAHYIHGKVFTEDGGESWFSNRDSSVPVVFPYKVPIEPEQVYLLRQPAETEGTE